MLAEGETLVVREFERIPVGGRWDLRSRSIGAEDVALIDRFQSRGGVELFRLGYRSIQATNWVGTLGIGRNCIEVLPKIDDPAGPLDARRTRANLLWMASRAGLVPVTPADIVRLANVERPLLVAFLDLYVAHLGLEWQRGPVKQYISEEENRAYLRGKLLFSQQLRSNLVQRQRFFTAADEFTVDNPLSRLLKAALNRCASQRLSAGVSRKARALLLEFADVADWEPSLSEAEQIQVTRQQGRFTLLATLARLILSSTSPESNGGGEQIYSLMFDMNEVFERFITAELQAALAGTRFGVVPQLASRSLLVQSGKGRFQLRPDIGILRGDEVVCLVDTKWKRLDPQRPHHNVNQADIYQMYAYGKEYAAPMTILLYPRWGDLPQSVAEYHHVSRVGEETKRIRVTTVDLGVDFSRPGVFALFRESLAGMVVDFR